MLHVKRSLSRTTKQLTKKAKLDDRWNTTPRDVIYLILQTIMQEYDHLIQSAQDKDHFTLYGTGRKPGIYRDMANAIRVCKNWYSIGKPLLYNKDNVVWFEALDSFVSNDNVPRVSKALSDPDINIPYCVVDNILLTATYKNYTDMALVAIGDSRIDPSVDFYRSMYWAVQHDNDVILGALLKHPSVDPTYDNQFLLYKAIGDISTNVLDLLLRDPRFDPCAQDNKALKLTCNDIDMFAIVLRHPKIDKNEAYIIAAKYGETALLKFIRSECTTLGAKLRSTTIAKAAEIAFENDNTLMIAYIRTNFQIRGSIKRFFDKYDAITRKLE